MLDVVAPHKRTRFGWVVPLVLGLATVIGLAGLDRAFYEQVSLRLNTTTPVDRDFYAMTRSHWYFIRTAFAHVAGVVIAAMLVATMHRDRWRGALRLLLAVGAAVAAAVVLEVLIGRARPNQADCHLMFAPLVSLMRLRIHNACFPSGEATMACALGAVLARLFPRGGGLFYSMAALASVARLVNGAHYLSDVAAGALLGLTVGHAAYTYFNTSGLQMLRAHRILETDRPGKPSRSA